MTTKKCERKGIRGDLRPYRLNFSVQKAEYSVSIARLVKTVMNVSMRYAADKKIIAENPTEGVNLHKKAEKKKYRTRSIDT